MLRIDKRQFAHDLSRVTSRIAFYAGIMSFKCGALSLRAEHWYNTLTERERG